MAHSLDFYRGFDEQFFYDEDRKKSSDKYKSFLERHQSLLIPLLVTPEIIVEDYSVYEELVSFKYEEKNPGPPLRESHSLRTTIDDLSQSAGISLTEQLQHYVAGRITSHLTRFIFPEDYALKSPRFGLPKTPQNNYCSVFGKELLRHFGNINSDDFLSIQEADTFNRVVGSEGKSVLLFWTLAPYIYLNLTERGILPSEGCSKIIKWVTNAYTDKYDGHTDLSAIHYDRILEALLQTHQIVTFYLAGQPLGYDERMPSHLKARLLAREVAAELIK